MIAWIIKIQIPKKIKTYYKECNKVNKNVIKMDNLKIYKINLLIIFFIKIKIVLKIIPLIIIIIV